MNWIINEKKYNQLERQIFSTAGIARKIFIKVWIAPL